MTDTIFAKYAAARQKYPDDIKVIEAEEERVKDLLAIEDYAGLPTTKNFLEMCRTQVIDTRRRLSTDRSLIADPEAQRDLWAIIDDRMWFISLVARDIQGELSLIEAGLDAELGR